MGPRHSATNFQSRTTLIFAGGIHRKLSVLARKRINIGGEYVEFGIKPIRGRQPWPSRAAKI